MGFWRAVGHHGMRKIADCLMWCAVGHSRELAACFNRMVKVPPHELKANAWTPVSRVSRSNCSTFNHAVLLLLNALIGSRVTSNGHFCLSYSSSISFLFCSCCMRSALRPSSPLDDDMKRSAWLCFLFHLWSGLLNENGRRVCKPESKLPPFL